jgi:protoporphyrinogen/coproporphyrinogen III oxidase
VHAFAARRIGSEAAEMLVDAAVSGISAGDSRRLSVRAQFPVMSEMEREHGSLLRAMFAKKKSPTGPSRLLSFDTGIGTLASGLAVALGDRVRSRMAAKSLERYEGAWRISTAGGITAEADHVVLAAPARAAAPLLVGLDARLASRLGDVDYAGLAVIALAYRVSDIPRPLDGYGYLTTRPEGLATLGVVWESSLFPGRAPEGWALLRVMMGGARRPDVLAMAEAEVVGLARQELQRVLGVTAAPLRSWVFMWPEAIAQYTVGHLERRAAIAEAVARHDGLTVCGTSYDGVSFNHAVKSGCAAARAVVERLWQRPAAEAAMAGVAGSA